jgi:hypothetical protein
MNDVTDKLEKLVEVIKTERDELHVRLHLLKAETKDEWEEVEQKWEYLEARLKKVREGVSESGEEVGAATAQLGREISTAYQRIRKAMK